LVKNALFGADFFFGREEKLVVNKPFVQNKHVAYDTKVDVLLSRMKHSCPDPQGQSGASEMTLYEGRLGSTPAAKPGTEGGRLRTQ